MDANAPAPGAPPRPTAPAPAIAPTATFIPIQDPPNMASNPTKVRNLAKWGRIPSHQTGKWQSELGFQMRMYNRYDSIKRKDKKDAERLLATLKSGELADKALAWEIVRREEREARELMSAPSPSPAVALAPQQSQPSAMAPPPPNLVSVPASAPETAPAMAPPPSNLSAPSQEEQTPLVENQQYVEEALPEHVFAQQQARLEGVRLPEPEDAPIIDNSPVQGAYSDGSTGSYSTGTTIALHGILYVAKWWDKDGGYICLCKDGSIHSGELELITWNGLGSDGKEYGWGAMRRNHAPYHKRKFEEKYHSNEEAFYHDYPQSFRWTCCGTSTNILCAHHNLLSLEACTCQYCEAGVPIPKALLDERILGINAQGLLRKLGKGHLAPME